MDRPTIEMRIAETMKLLRESKADNLVLATYTREEFAKLRPLDNYDEYKRGERLFAEGLAARGLLGRIRFQFIDAAGFRNWLARHPGIKPDEHARAAYATSLATGTDV